MKPRIFFIIGFFLIFLQQILKIFISSKEDELFLSVQYLLLIASLTMFLLSTNGVKNNRYSGTFNFLLGFIGFVVSVCSSVISTLHILNFIVPNFSTLENRTLPIDFNILGQIMLVSAFALNGIKNKKHTHYPDRF